MDFTERLDQAVGAGRARLETERRLDRAFETAWQQARDTAARLMDTARVKLRPAFGTVTFGHREDHTDLDVSRSENSEEPEFTLRFSPDRVSRQVVCSTQPGELLEEQRFDELPIDQSRIEDKIVEFVEAIYRHQAERGQAKGKLTSATW